MTPRPAPVPVALRQACAPLGIDAGAVGDLTVTGITVDSRDVRPGDVFAALPGAHVHGAQFVRQAAEAGAVALFTDPDGAALADGLLPVVTSAAPRRQVGALAAEVYRRPADGMLVLGVTGTNGKTTTTYLLDAGLRAAGHVTGVIGTVATTVGDRTFPTARTTPEAPELHALLGVMRDHGVTAVAMEVSSHALAMGRVDGCIVDVAGFTQLGVDHLDFHGSEEAYFAAKLSLFTPERSRRAVVCVDDDGGRRIAAAATTDTTTLSIGGDAQWRVTDVQQAEGGGARFVLRGPDGIHHPGSVGLLGDFNVTNAALAQTMLVLAGQDPQAVASGIGMCRGVPGRMERIGDDTGRLMLVVDYAHTADALARALEAVRPLAAGRVHVVFGCGGDRDAGKRPVMGRVAAELADVVVVTDDNPRSEPAEAIRRAVLAGAEQVEPGRRAELLEIGDRAAAIERTVAHAADGDVVLVAGKGHESGQEVEGKVTPFDDREVVERAWSLRRAARTGGGSA